MSQPTMLHNQQKSAWTQALDLKETW